MDLVIGLWWSLAFTVIMLVLGALNYFLGQSHSDIQHNVNKSPIDSINQSQSTRTTTRRKNRNANRKQRQLAALLASTNSDENEVNQPTIIIDEEDSVSIHPTEDDDDEQFEDPLIVEEEQIVPEPIESVDLPESNTIIPSKPQASVAPVKQSYPSTTDQSKNRYHSKSNGHRSIGRFHSHQEYNSLPPRFQQQRQQKYLAKKSFPKRQPIDTPSQNGYSSESDTATESSSTAPPPSIESQPSSSNRALDECMSFFDHTSLNSNQLEIILNKILTHSSTNRLDDTLQSLLDETYRNQGKILALELQSEKTRVQELSKINADLDATIRQLQQPNPNIPTYQQTILHYQMHIKRITDENSRLIHQLHTYSIMPASINELKQQQFILNEQLQEITMRNNHLQKEIIDAERARKQAADIYHKVDKQKQNRIDQLVNDLNKYKKIEEDLQSLQSKHQQLESHFHCQLTQLTEQRDHLHQTRDQLIQQLPSDEHSDRENELTELQSKNVLLKQRHTKIIDQLTKLQHEGDDNH